MSKVRNLEEKEDRTIVLSKHMFQHWQEQVSNRESISTSAKNRLKESEPQLCFKNGAAALAPDHNIRRRDFAMLPKSEPPRASTIEPSPCRPFLIKSGRPSLPIQGIELITTDAIACQPKIFSQHATLSADRLKSCLAWA